MTLMQAYAAGKPLCFYVDDSRPRLITAMVEMPRGYALFDGNVLDQYGSMKCTAFIQGKAKGSGPWRVDPFTFEVITDDHPARPQLELFEKLSKGMRGLKQRLEARLPEVYFEQTR